jgi:hypothetical protein
MRYLLSGTFETSVPVLDIWVMARQLDIPEWPKLTLCADFAP